jgi:CheY-like chemotaxis protein/signal transduction histidine kinase
MFMNIPFSLLITSWVPFTLALLMLSVLLIYGLIRLRVLKNQKHLVEQQLVERTELLTFATERERKALEQVAIANQNKRQLLSRVNHEIRTPMNGVIGMAALMAETPLTAEQRDYNETIRNCGESLLAVINEILHGDILAHSKIESGKIELELRELDIRNSIEEVFEVFAGKIAHMELELLYQVDPQVPAHIVGDDQRIRQILMNLVENSIKVTRQGEIVVSVHMREYSQRKAADGQNLVLYFEVRDTGAGIDPDRLKLLMHGDPGAQAGAGPKPGIGLVICRKLIGLMGGELTITSKINEGTTVAFTLNVKTTDVPKPVQQDRAFAGLEGKQVLIVDDHITGRYILKEVLEAWKLSPVVAGSAKEALDVLGQTPDVNLIITDLRMPGMDGIALARVVHQAYPKIPIMLMSKEGTEDSHQHGDIFTSVIHKPLRRDMLHKHVISSLRHQDDPVGADDVQAGQKLYSTFAQDYPLRILIAEDNPVNQKLAIKVLTKLGYNPQVAQDGKEVLEVVSNSRYDLILMDVQMPAMDGLEATRMIRLCLEVQPVIIAMTANSMQGDRDECLRAGMDDYISKPIHLEELVIVLEKWALVVKEKP